MPDLRQQIREHYDAKAIPAERAEAILARGRAAAAGEEEPKAENVIALPASRARLWRRTVSLAAAILVFLGLAGWWVQSNRSRVEFAAVAPRIIEFFESSPELAHAPKDKTALRDWLLARGAPADCHIPASLMPLESFACSVVDVHGRKTYLSCYWRENKPDRGDRDLIHLLVGRRSDFKDAPASSEPQRREMNGWSFASWSEGDVVYTLATPAPAEKLTPFLAWQGPLWILALAL
jgi:hypothetical protein